MSLTDAFEMGTAIITSLGGGGALVYGLSGYLGKRWADSALEKQRHEYAELLQSAKSELDKATNRYQVELDRLGLAHTLRMTEEFSHLGQLYKYMAILASAFNRISGSGLRSFSSDKEENEKFACKLREEYEIALENAHRFFLEEKLFVPKAIADATNETLQNAIIECQLHQLNEANDDYCARVNYQNDVRKYLKQFNDGMTAIEPMMREHIEGKLLTSTISNIAQSQ